jgi:hypothetical protein
MKIYVAILVCLIACARSSAQVHERRPGASFRIEKSYDFTYQTSIIYMQKAGHTLSENNREAGQISSSIGAVHRTKLKEIGYRVFLSLIKDSPTITTVYVLVDKYERPNPKWAVQAYQNRGMDKDETMKVTAELQDFLKQTPETTPPVSSEKPQ